MDSKEVVGHTLEKNKHRTLNGGQKKNVFGCQREKARKALRKGDEGFPKGGIRTCQPEQGKGNEFHLHKRQRQR